LPAFYFIFAVVRFWKISNHWISPYSPYLLDSSQNSYICFNFLKFNF
jgi:hypothetical protein